MVVFLAAAGAFFAGGLTYALGLFDKVEFEEKSSLFDNDDTKDAHLVAIVVKCQSKYIGKNIMRLLNAAKRGVDRAHDDSAKLQAAAAAKYGSPEGADSLSVGLYFDDPTTVEHPRWAVGWCIDVDFAEAQEMAKQMEEITAGPHDTFEFQAVRIGNGPVIRGSIPWRTTFTAAVAPLLWWGKAMQTYKDGGYTATGNVEAEGAVALEVYVTGPDMAREHIDYIVLHGDVKTVWSDLYPSTQGTEMNTIDDRS